MTRREYGKPNASSPFAFPFFNPPSPMSFGFSSCHFASSSPLSGDTAPRNSATVGATFVSTDSSTGIIPPKTSIFFTFPPEPSSTVSSVFEKTCLFSEFSSTASGDTVTGNSATAPPWMFGASYSSTAASTDCSTSTMPPITLAFSTFSQQSVRYLKKPCDSTTTNSYFVSAVHWFSNAISSATTSAKTTSVTVSPIPPSDSVSSTTSSSSVSAITTKLTAAATTPSLSGKAYVSTSPQPQSTVSAPEFVTVPASCSSEQDEVAAILARKCEKPLSCRAARQAQGREQNERHISVLQPWTCGAKGFETTSSSKPVIDAAAEQKYGESKPCSIPMTGAPTSTPSVSLNSKSGSLLLPSSQPAEEEQPYLPPVDLLDSTILMWERVVANKKTNQEVTEEGLRHFYEGINYFCLLSERLQVATDKYNEAAKARDDMEKMNSSLKDKLAVASRKLEDSKKEKERLELELAGAKNKITALTGEKESILRVQTILHQTISELRRELEEAGPAAIQKYKASCLYRQELMEYAAPYMGNGVKLAIEKIKAKDPTFDPATYSLDMYILPPEADDQEFSSEESDGVCPSRVECGEAKCSPA